MSVHVFYLVGDRLSFAAAHARLLGPCTSGILLFSIPLQEYWTTDQKCFHMSSGVTNPSPHTCEASTLCPEPSPQLKFPFFSFLLHSMRVEVKGQFTGVGSPNNHTDSRDQAQVLSGLAATQLSYLVHPKLAFSINHFC